MKLAAKLAALAVLTLGIARAGTVVEDNFDRFDRFRSTCVNQTVLMVGQPGILTLGGNSATGERAGLEYAGFEVNDFQVTLTGLVWTHNVPIGGHPTEIAMLDDANLGYGVRIMGGAVEIFAQRADGRTSLAKTEAAYDGLNGYTEARNWTFSRTRDGLLAVSADGIAELAVRDTEFSRFTRLDLAYEVYLHGYGASLQAVELTSSTDGVPPVPPAPFALSGGQVLLDDRFDNLANAKSVCAAETMIMQHAPGHLILGGPGSTGERAAFEMAGFTANDWCLAIDDLNWSHNSAPGGHPTEILLTGAGDRGYGVRLAGGNGELFRQDGPGQRTVLATAPAMFAPESGFTVPRQALFARNAAGEIYFALSGLPKSVMNATDTAIQTVDKLTMAYEVYTWGFGCTIKGLFLKTLSESAVSGNHTAIRDGLSGKKIAIYDAESLLPAERQFGFSAKAQAALSDAQVTIVAPGQLADADYEVLILPAQAITPADFRAVDQALRDDKIVLILGTIDWKAALADADPAVQALAHRVYQRILGNGWPPVKTALSDGGKITLSNAGRAWLGSDFDRFQVKQAQVLSPYNSIEKQALPLWVARENWLTATNRERNWIQQEDNFVNSAAQLQRHAAGEYAGARVFISGLPLDGNSPLNPLRPEFVTLVSRVLAAQAEPVTLESENLIDVLANSAPLTRRDFFRYPAQVFGTLCFSDYSYLDNDAIFVEDLNMGGFNVACYCVPWLRTPAPNGDVVDWERLDWIMAECKRIGKKLMLDPYPETFDWRHYAWRGERTGYDPVVSGPYLKALKAIATRYKDDDTLVAMWCTSYTGDVSFSDWTSFATPEVLAMWQKYLQETKGYTLETLNARYHTAYADWSEVKLPTATENLPYNISPAWSDSLDFHIDSFQAFMRQSIETLRSEIPDLPLTTRGNYVDVAISAAVAAEYPDVAVHSECVETTYDTEGYFRSIGRSFDIPITAENGWPKALPAAMRMAMADYLMGDYTAWTFSFAGPRWARDVFRDLNDAALARTVMNASDAHYSAESELGLLIGDTTLYASRPPIFFSVEGLPHLQSVLEKSGFHFIGVSAQIPRFKQLKVIVDDGTNAVITAAFRDQLIAWIRQGGIFVTFPTSAAYTMDGSATFWAESGVTNAAGSTALGSGRVIVLPKVEAADPVPMVALLKELGLQRDFEMSPLITNATLASPDGKVRYLILFDKSAQLVGSFFTESWYDGTIAALATQEISVRPNFPVSRATELVTGQALPLRDGAVSVTVPATNFRVIEFR